MGLKVENIHQQTLTYLECQFKVDRYLLEYSTFSLSLFFFEFVS